MKKYLIKRKSIFLISSILIVIDQTSKALATYLVKDYHSIALIPRILHLRLVRNTGAAFSLFADSTGFLALLSLCISMGLILWICQNKTMNILKGLGLSFLLGGCIGNGIDRFRLGYVNDFIELRAIDFPIFNFADIAINIAVICLLMENFNKRKNKLS